MEQENVRPSLICRLSNRLSRKVRLLMLGAALLLAGAIALTTFNYMVSKAPKRVHGAPARLAWYVQDGRLKADLHTFAGMCGYVLAGESETPSAPNPVNPPVARNGGTTSPKS
jgi:hypothetical protein